MEKAEYPKWLYSAAGEAVLVPDLDAHAAYSEWAESPDGPFGTGASAKKAAKRTPNDADEEASG